MVVIIVFKILVSIYIGSIRLKYFKIGVIWKCSRNILKVFYTFGVYLKRLIFFPFFIL